LVKQITEQQQGIFTTNTQINTKGHCNVLPPKGMEVDIHKSSHLIFQKDVGQFEKIQEKKRNGRKRKRKKIVKE